MGKDVVNKRYTIEDGKVRVISWNVSELYPTKIQMSSMYGKFGKYDGGFMYLDTDTVREGVK